MNPQRDRLVLARRRRKAATMFKRGLSPTEVARRLGVRRQSAHAWFKSWQAGGAEKLESRGAPGPTPKLSSDDLECICALVRRGAYACGCETDLWTLTRIAKLIEDFTWSVKRHRKKKEPSKKNDPGQEDDLGVKFHPGHVWHLLRSIGLSCQRPEGHPPDLPASRSRKLNSWTTREWKARTWRSSGKPGIKRRRP